MFEEMMALGERFRLEEDLKSIEFSTGCKLKLDHTNQIIKVDQKYPFYFRFEDIISVELIVDEKTSSGKSTTSVLGRAALLGVLTGGAGAIVGAMTAKSEVRHEIRKVAISLVAPHWDPINKPLSFRHELYRPGYFKGYGSDEAIKVGAKVVEQIVASKEKVSSSPVSPDLAQSLLSLADLHGRGLLNDAEFALAKQRLLG